MDILFQYTGAKREEAIFNILHGDERVDANPVTEEKSGSLSEILKQAESYMKQELVFRIADGYIYIQEGYDYTIYDEEMKELDGSVYDNQDIPIYEALDDIVEDIKQHYDTNGVKGEITSESELIPLNHEDFEQEMERRNHVEPVFAFTVAECGEFHQFGEYYDDITTVEEAVERWNQLKDSPLNDVASIGIFAHKPGQEQEDEQVDLVARRVMDVDILQYYPRIQGNKQALAWK